jgi:osmotically-inducible protein OsmY
MKQPNRLAAVFSAILLLSVIGCAPTPTREGTGEYVDDSWITTKVKSAILKEPGLKSAAINVETFKGTVQLSGFVKSPEEKSKAGEVARTIKGVHTVENDIRLM